LSVQTTYQQYLDREEYNLLDYERNDEILESFKEKNPKLSDVDDRQLIAYLTDENVDWPTQYFVADLLYLYEEFSPQLMEAMLNTGVYFRDPSFNRIFLRPCMRSSRQSEAMNWLVEKFQGGNMLERIGISNLYYWLKAEPVERTSLRNAIATRAKNTDNLLELYFYQLAIGKIKRRLKRIPKDADTLIKKIKGNSEYENFVTEKLGWEI